mmetsp:Transcript_80226/g.171770  ORF Transcript_80226/g.171770 Transcript_80226/m.171770 type:complete len:733 (+) Transcript_80226:79-2277(+)
MPCARPSPFWLALVQLVATVLCSAIPADEPPADKGVSEQSSKRIVAIVDTLGDIVKSIDNQEEQETANYRLYQTWCETEEADLSLSLNKTQLQLEQSQGSQQENAATMAELEHSLTVVNEEILETKNAIDQAQSIRDEESTKYDDELLLNKQSISQVSSAITIVGKVHGEGGFLQRGAVKRLQLNEPGESKYVQGIMEGLKTRLEKTQQQMTQTEEGKKKAHAALSKTKKEQLVSLQQEATDATLRLQQARVDAVELKRIATKSAERIKELTATREETLHACEAKARAWRARSEDRANEKEALREAIAVVAPVVAEVNATPAPEPTAAVGDGEAVDEDAVDEDDAELTSGDSASAPGLSFLQAKARGRADADRASLSSARTGVRHGVVSLPGATLGTQLIMLAVHSNATRRSGQHQDAYSVAKDVVKQLIAILQGQQKDEADTRKSCTSSLAEKAKEKTDIEDALDGVNATINFKAAESARLLSEVQEIEASIASAKAQLDNATVIRTREKDGYESGSKDRHLAVKVLKQAGEVLKRFYSSKEQVASLAQAARKSGRAAPAPPTWSGDSRKELPSAGVLALLEKVAEDITREQQAAEADEKASAAAFERLREEERADFDLMMQEITERVKHSAKLKVWLGADRETKTEKSEDLEALKAEIHSLHGQCDELLENFQARTKARSEELEQLRDVFDILSGSSIAPRTGEGQPEALALLQDATATASTRTHTMRHE